MIIVTQQIQDLAKTLIASKLAASASEAQRMAADMLGVAEKVSADDKKEHIYAVAGYGTRKKNDVASAQQSSQPSRGVESTLYGSKDTFTSTNSSSQPLDKATEPKHPEPRITTTISEQGENNIDSESGNSLTSHNNDNNASQPSQQATMLATESMKESTVPRPEDNFAKQFEGKNLSELSEDNSTSDFLGLQTSQKDESEASLETGWPEEPEKTQEVATSKKTSGFSEEEKKLQKEVDISKIFNFGK